MGDQVRYELHRWLDPGLPWEDRVEAYRQNLQDEAVAQLNGTTKVRVVLYEEAEEQLKELLENGEVDMAEQQKLAFMQEQINEAHRQLSRHEERFEWIAQRLKSMDERDKKALEDIGSIKERIFNGFGDQIANTNAQVDKISKNVAQLSRYFQQHLNSTHITKDEVREIAEWVHSQGVDRWEEKEKKDMHWLKSHKLEIIAVITPLMSGAMVLLATILTGG